MMRWRCRENCVGLQLIEALVMEILKMPRKYKVSERTVPVFRRIALPDHNVVYATLPPSIFAAAPEASYLPEASLRTRKLSISLMKLSRVMRMRGFGQGA